MFYRYETSFRFYFRIIFDLKLFNFLSVQWKLVKLFDYAKTLDEFFFFRFIEERTTESLLHQTGLAVPFMDLNFWVHFSCGSGSIPAEVDIIIPLRTYSCWFFTIWHRLAFNKIIIISVMFVTWRRTEEWQNSNNFQGN